MSKGRLGGCGAVNGEKEFEALGICRLGFAGVGNEGGGGGGGEKIRRWVTLRNFSEVAKFRNPCKISYGMLLELPASRF